MSIYINALAQLTARLLLYYRTQRYIILREILTCRRHDLQVSLINTKPMGKKTMSGKEDDEQEKIRQKKC